MQGKHNDHNFVLRIAWFGEKVDQKKFHNILPPPQIWLKGLGEMFEGYSAETCAGNIPLVPMGAWAEGPACADTGARTPIDASGIFVDNNEEVIESDEYGKAVFHAVDDNMDEEDFTS